MTVPPFLAKYLKKFSPKRGDHHLRPSRDWLVLLSAFLLLLIGSVAWNVWFFASVLDGEEIVTPGSAEGVPGESSLLRANAAFEARMNEEARYRNEYRFVDPSR